MPGPSSAATPPLLATLAILSAVFLAFSLHGRWSVVGEKHADVKTARNRKLTKGPERLDIPSPLDVH